jgi:putative transposase
MSLFCETNLINRQNMYKTYLHCDPERLEKTVLYKDAILSMLETNRGLSGSQLRLALVLKGIDIGRDKFYRIVNNFKLTCNARKKAWHKRRHQVKNQANMIINHTFHRVFEVLFADYTEIETGEGKLQLLLIMDLVSRYITSYRICNTCKSEPVTEAITESLALKKRLKLRYKSILHTDKGSEFVNHAVKQTAILNDIILSNTGKNHCYENAFIESLNRTLKHSHGLRVKFADKAEASRCIREAINNYNTMCKHSSLAKRTPYCVLMNYTGKKRSLPEGKQNSCPLPGQGARVYSKSLIVKIKKIKIDNNKKTPK